MASEDFLELSFRSPSPLRVNLVGPSNLETDPVLQELIPRSTKVKSRSNSPSDCTESHRLFAVADDTSMQSCFDQLVQNDAKNRAGAKSPDFGVGHVIYGKRKRNFKRFRSVKKPPNETGVTLHKISPTIESTSSTKDSVGSHLQDERNQTDSVAHGDQLRIVSSFSQATLSMASTEKLGAISTNQAVSQDLFSQDHNDPQSSHVNYVPTVEVCVQADSESKVFESEKKETELLCLKSAAAKKLFYSSSRPLFIKPLEKDGDILKLDALEESSFEFTAKALQSPQTKKGLVPFSAFAKKSLKRPSSSGQCSQSKKRKKQSTNNLSTKKTEVGSAMKITSDVKTDSDSFKTPELVSSKWDSKTTYLAESQAIVTDTQIFKATEDIEMTMLVTPKVTFKTPGPSSATKISSCGSVTSGSPIPPQSRLESCQPIITENSKKTDIINVLPSKDANNFFLDPGRFSTDFLYPNNEDSNIQLPDVDLPGGDTINAEFSFLKPDRSVVGSSSDFSNAVSYFTGGGKYVVGSEEALLKTKNLFFSVDDNGARLDENVDKETSLIAEKGTAGFKVGSCQNPDNPVAGTSSNFTNAVGFTTGGGKPVVISEEALLRTKEIFRNMEENGIWLGENAAEETSLLAEKDTAGFKVGSCPNRDNPVAGTSSNFTNAGGFTTGGGKSVVISEEALLRSKEIFRNLEENGIWLGENAAEETSLLAEKDTDGFKVGSCPNRDNPVAGTSSNFTNAGGFTTGGGKSVVISEEALLRTKEIFRNLEENDIWLDENAAEETSLPERNGTSGFKVGSCPNPDNPVAGTSSNFSSAVDFITGEEKDFFSNVENNDTCLEESADLESSCLPTEVKNKVDCHLPNFSQCVRAVAPNASYQTLKDFLLSSLVPGASKTVDQLETPCTVTGHENLSSGIMSPEFSENKTKFTDTKVTNVEVTNNNATYDQGATASGYKNAYRSIVNELKSDKQISQHDEADPFFKPGRRMSFGCNEEMLRIVTEIFSGSFEAATKEQIEENINSSGPEANVNTAETDLYSPNDPVHTYSEPYGLDDDIELLYQQLTSQTREEEEKVKEGSSASMFWEVEDVNRRGPEADSFYDSSDDETIPEKLNVADASHISESAIRFNPSHETKMVSKESSSDSDSATSSQGFTKPRFSDLINAPIVEDIDEASLEAPQTVCQNKINPVECKAVTTGTGQDDNMSEVSSDKIFYDTGIDFPGAEIDLNISVAEHCPLQPTVTHTDIGTATSNVSQASEDSDQETEMILPDSQGAQHNPLVPDETFSDVPLLNIITNTREAVEISDEPMQKKLKIFADSDSLKAIKSRCDVHAILSAFAEDETSHKHGVDTTSRGGKEAAVSEESLNIEQELLVEKSYGGVSDVVQELPVRLGFTTGTGKKVEISENSIQQVQKMYPYSDKKFIALAKEQADCIAPSTVEADKTVEVSIVQLENNDNITFKQLTYDSTPFGKEETSHKQDIVCNTEADDKVEVLEENLFTGRKILADDESSFLEAEDHIGFPGMAQEREIAQLGFTTGTGKAVAVSGKSIQQVRKMFADGDSLAESILGFCTGGGKSVVTSEESVVAKTLFSNLEDSTESETIAKEQTVMTEASTSVVVSEKSMLEVENMQAEVKTKEVKPEVNSPTDFASSAQEQRVFSKPCMGFTTGTGKTVEVSEKSVQQMRKFLAEDHSVFLEPTMSFSTGAETREVSNESMLKAQNKVDDVGIKEAKPEQGSTTNFSTLAQKQLVPSKPCMGFTAGTGMNVDVSKDSLLNNKSEQESIEYPTVEFPTMAQEKAVEVSEQSLRDEEKVITASSKDTTADITERTVSKPNLDVRTGEVRKVLVSEDFIKKNIEVSEITEEISFGINSNMDPEDDTSLLIFDADTDTSIEIPGKLGEAQNKSTVENTTKPCDESYSALIENTDWEEQIVPNWLVSPETSRTNTSRDSLEDRLSQSEISYIMKKRQAARANQKRKHRKTQGKALQGSLLQIKSRDRTLSWREFLPQGPAVCAPERLRELGVRDFVLGIDAENAANFRFYGPDFYRQSTCDTNTNGIPVGDGFLLIFDDSNYAGWEEFERAFLAGAGVYEKLVPPGWLRNHYRLIVWKLACYERSCGSRFAGSTLHPHNVMLLLKFRYDLEIDRSRSSALKRICERDDPAAKPLVLCVVKVNKGEDGYSFHVTDGWYIIEARADTALNGAIESGKLRVGTKILTLGAELIGCEQGSPPLEIPGGTYLKLATNSTRRVRWHCKLGFKNLHVAPTVPLNSVAVGGGVVFRVKVVITRVYPVVYVEKLEEGRNITRNARTEQKVAAEFQRQQEYQMEQLCSQLQKEEFSKAAAGKRPRLLRITSQTLARAKTAEELCNMVENALDPSQVEGMLTKDQKRAIISYQESRRAAEAKALEEKLKTAEMRQRIVSDVLRVKVTGLDHKDCKIATLSWWHPADELMHAFVEGKVVSLYNVTPGNSINQLYLNSTRQSRIEVIPMAPDVRWCARKVTQISDITSEFRPDLDELDVVGLVVFIHQINTGSYKLETVYLTDTGGSFFGLVFWKGLEEFSFESILTEGCVLSVSNVHWRRNSASSAIPCGYVSETTVVSSNPKTAVLKDALEALKTDLEDEDIPALIARCQDAIICQLEKFKTQPKSKQTSFSKDQSPWSKTLPDNSPGPSSRPQYFNGFALQPQAASTPIRSTVQKRVDRLKEYGELPPISPLPLKNSVSFSKKFQAPLVFDSPPMDL